MGKSIVLTQEDIERWTPVLTTHYRNRGLSEDEIQKTIQSVLAECQTGWNRAPRDLDTRVKMKSGFQWKSFENLRPRKKEEEPEVDLEEDVDFDFFSTMNEKERTWWDQRLSEYKKDFDFNASSDKPLIEQLLAEELIQRRVVNKQLKFRDRDYSKQLNDGLKRVTELQIKLGITREQRAGVLNKIDGNVAQIAVELDEKLAKMPEELRKQYEEEMKYASMKAQRPPINILPPIERVEALLGGGHEINANVTSAKMSEISEAVGKEISDKRQEIPKPPFVELPEGVDVS